jgi:guanyl-specific ribonuclease Sa
MSRRGSPGWSWLAPLLVVAIVLLLWREGAAPPASPGADAVEPPAAAAAQRESRAAPPATHDELPAEAWQTLELIAAGGPFPYDRDGTVFQNRERRLPEQSTGYYREYTVRTPGERDRGARRIVAGGDPPEVYYYTDDHYRTFRRLEGVHGRR